MDKCPRCNSEYKNGHRFLWHLWYKHFSSKWEKFVFLLGVLGLLLGIASVVWTSMDNALLRAELQNQSQLINSMDLRLEQANSKATSQSNMILDLTVQLNQTRQELDSAKNELEVLSTKNKDEIIMTIYEVNAIGLSDQAKNEYFMTKFGFSYEQATEILNYLSKTDDFDIASQALFFSDYETSIYHFDLALIKDPGNMNSKIGKIVALNGLGRTNESRSIAREIESTYSDKKFLYKLLGDSYCAESNFSECSDYYIRATGMYLNETPTDISSLSLVMDICEIRYLGLYNSSYVTVLGPDTDGWKVCDIDLIDLGQTVMIRYKTDN